MTTDAAKRRTNILQASFGPRWVRLGLLAAGAMALLAAILLGTRWWFPAAQPVQAEDLLLQSSESVGRVRAAANAGDVVAQSTLGTAYLDGKGMVPKDVRKAIGWLRKVVNRDRSEFDRIKKRMQWLVETRPYQVDSQRRREIDLEYLDLAAQRLSYEAAFLELIEVYLGAHGASHGDVDLALHYMRSGADYGLPSSQRILGVVTGFGLLGVPRNEIQATILLSEAAAQGDWRARRVLIDLLTKKNTQQISQSVVALSELSHT